jgi:hypothetical protein
MLFSCGCEQGSKGVATTPAPAIKTESQPVKSEKATEPNQAQEKKEPVKTAETDQPKPSVQDAPPAEPNIKQAAISPVPIQPAESNAPKSQAAPALHISAAELCNNYTEFLKKYVDQQGMVDYRTLSYKKLELVNLLDKFRNLDQKEYDSWSKENKIAFWINAYNLNFIRIILDNYPIESTRVLRIFWPPNSIKHIKGLWDGHKFIVMNEEFTLKEIDTRFFQKEFDEPRVFCAIFYASISGPPLLNEAYCGKNLSAQLDTQVKKFLAGEHAYKISRENGKVYLSSMFDSSWYGQQFVAKYGTDRKFKQQDPVVRAVFNFLTKYLSSQDVDYLETGNYTVEYMRYDWTLNELGGQ